MTILVSTPSKTGTAGKSRTPAHRLGPSTDDTATAAGTTEFEEFATALRAWADEITAARTSLDALHNQTPPASVGPTQEE